MRTLIDPAQQHITLMEQGMAALKAANERLREMTIDIALRSNERKKQVDRLEKQVRALLDHCPDGECATCARIVCPHGDERHLHHDGCPTCSEREHK